MESEQPHQPHTQMDPHPGNEMDGPTADSEDVVEDSTSLKSPPPSKKMKVESLVDPAVGGAETAEGQQQPSSSPPSKGKKKRRSKKGQNVDPKIVEIRRTIQMACRDNNLVVAVVAYHRAKRDSIVMEAQSFYNLLNLCNGVTSSHGGGGGGRSAYHTPVTPTNQNKKEEEEQSQSTTSIDDTINKGHESVGSNPPQKEPMSPEERLKFAFILRDEMKEMNLPLNEAAYTAFVKLLSTRRQFEEAESVLHEAEQTQQCKPKLRLYSSLLVAYCDSHLLQQALQLWKRMIQIKIRESQKKATSSLTANNTAMDMTEREYASLMKCATAVAVTAATADGRSTGSSSSTVMEYVLSELAEEVPVPSKETVNVILQWFTDTSSNPPSTAVAIPSKDDDGDDGSYLQLLHDITVLQYGDGLDQAANPTTKERPPSMGPVVPVEGGSFEISTDCSIDTKTGTLTEGCLQGFSLLPVPLSDRAFEEMKTMNSAIVFDGKVAGNVCEFQGGRKGKKRKGNQFSLSRRQEDWRRFTDFLKCSPTWDVVIDGANVGYFNQNFASAPKHVDYEQIDWIVQHFRRSSKNPPKVLLVMHTRHFVRDMVPNKYRSLVDRWRNDGILYQTPFGMNDDWFWMHAALEYRTLVATNDEMRDHSFQMFSPRSFLRWKERHQVYFDFGAWERDDHDPNQQGRQHRHRKVELRYPNVYSRRIQRIANGEGLVVPLPTKEDEQEYQEHAFEANNDRPIAETYLCIRMKKT